MLVRRRSFGSLAVSALGLSLLLAVGTGCGGAPSRLITVKAGSGDGPIQLEVENQTSAAINSLFLARTESVPDQLDNTSPEAQNLWGPDLLSGAIPSGVRRPVAVPGAGRWDVRAVDRDGRYQHITGLKLQAGGRYILELNDGGWRVR